jgi:predicted transcriptional regulator
MDPSSISASEFDVLKVLWEEGPATVRAVTTVLEAREHDWAYTTVQTLLNRLCNKQAATSDSSGQAHVYTAAVSREDLLQLRLSDLADELCDGATAPVVQALVAGKRFSRKEVDHFRRLLDELEGKQRGGKRGRKR